MGDFLLVCLFDAASNKNEFNDACLYVSVPRMQFNFVGKLLGPKGNSLKRLQEETLTKMAILGRGSMRDKNKVRLLTTPSIFLTFIRSYFSLSLFISFIYCSLSLSLSFFLSLSLSLPAVVEALYGCCLILCVICVTILVPPASLENSAFGGDSLWRILSGFLPAVCWLFESGVFFLLILNDGLGFLRHGLGCWSRFIPIIWWLLMILPELLCISMWIFSHY